MSNRARRLLTLLLCLGLCVSLPGLVPLHAAADQDIPKVLSTTSYTPVALMEVANVAVATSTAGCYVESYGWYTASGWVTDRFNTDVTTVRIVLHTQDGYRFSDSVAVYLNNIPAAFSLSNDNHTLTLERSWAPEIWTPTIIKQPGNETVDLGGTASYVVTGLYTRSYQWHFVNPGTYEDFSVDALNAQGVTTSEDGKNKIIIYNVPAYMDGWHVYVKFIGASWASKDSNYALLKVRGAAEYLAEHPEEGMGYFAAEAEAKAQAEAEAEAAAQAEAEAQAAAEAEAEAEAAAQAEAEAKAQAEAEAEAARAEAKAKAHQHSFPEEWSYDDQKHWLECECGERTGEAAHDIVWITEQRPGIRRPGLERGKCSVCDFEVTRDLPASTGDFLRVTVIGIAALTLLTLIVLAVDSARARRRRRKKRKAKHQAKH